MPISWVFWRDNAPIHVSVAFIDWFEGEGLSLIYWPSRPPDLIIIENILAALSKLVYARKWQEFESVLAIKNSIL